MEGANKSVGDNQMNKNGEDDTMKSSRLGLSSRYATLFNDVESSENGDKGSSMMSAARAYEDKSAKKHGHPKGDDDDLVFLGIVQKQSRRGERPSRKKVDGTEKI